MGSLNDLSKQIKEIEEKIHYQFSDKDFLIQAFIHRSFLNENSVEKLSHNERLEFLGDAVLGLIVSEHLYTSLPDYPEGHLSDLRSSIVDANSCAEFIKKLNLQEYLLMGKGEMLSGGQNRISTQADLFEAIIGAIYLDGGLEKARDFLFSNFKEAITGVIKEPPTNWKAMLQDYAQKKHKEPPEYLVVKEEGPDHQKTFHIEVNIQGKVVGEGVGQSKKEAEQQAAENACMKVLEGE